MEVLGYPAAPLIAVDPFFSVWSCADTLYEETTRHWTGRRQSLVGLLNIDGMAYRFMGKIFADGRYNMEPRALTQTNVEVHPMRTVYTFENAIVRLTLTFMTPLLTDDFKLMSRPVSYISYDIEALDGKTHEMQLLFGADASISVDDLTQEVTAKVYDGGACVGRGDNGVLAYSGDGCNINWGWLHLYSAGDFAASVRTAKEIPWRFSVVEATQCIPSFDFDAEKPFALDKQVIYLTLQKDFTLNGKESGFICAAYDDIHSLSYLNKVVDAYYKKDGDTFEDVCKKAIDEYADICVRVERAEADLLLKAEKFGKKYQEIISLVYRQVIAAHKLTWDGEEIQFVSKECFSNGCAATLDVTYPSIPMFLLLEPTLVEGMLNPLFKFARTPEWTYDFAPHDVGRYPLVDRQRYGANRLEDGTQIDGYRDHIQMPVEESGNAILCVYTICHYKNDISYFVKNKDLMDMWVEYLVKYGLDPENQLCTDDFAGHLAHNCNLSVKAIMGIAAYAKLMEKIGETAVAEKYLAIAKDYAQNWEKMADDGDHYRLAFDQEGSWSIKYNMVWDKMFGWGIFSDAVFEKEVAYYKKMMNPYGLPLDSRSDYTKSDWQMWSVRLTEDADYTARIIDAMYKFLNETYPRVPFTDWYFTSEPKERGFQNRTVQGGLFMPMI